jgi:dipeptidyl-peptidase-3
VDKYALKVDIQLRDEVQERVKKLDVVTYIGCVMPMLFPVYNKTGQIKDIRVEYPLQQARQILEYSKFTKVEKTAAIPGE